MDRKRNIIGAGVVLLVAAGIAIGGVVAWGVTNTKSQQEPQTVDLTAPQVLPDTVAVVNGKPVSGKLADLYIANGTSADAAYQNVVDQEVLDQAAIQLGLTPNYEEARGWVQALEASWADASPEEKEEIEAILAVQDLPTSDLADNPSFVATYGVAGLRGARMLQYIYEQAGVNPVSPEAEQARQSFLAQERGKANIFDCRSDTNACEQAVAAAADSP